MNSAKFISKRKHARQMFFCILELEFSVSQITGYILKAQLTLHESKGVLKTTISFFFNSYKKMFCNVLMISPETALYNFFNFIFAI